MSDVIIAALALEHACSLLTVDRHFDDIPGLDIIKTT
jgi:predicted nucleic acid-binding protein